MDSTAPSKGLLPLPPIMGDGVDRESLISYLVRLARAHQVGVRQLLKHVIWPALQLNADSMYTPFFRDEARTINRVSRYARAFADGLGQLTAVEDLDRLTFLSWQGVIPERNAGFLAKEVRWCPLCLAEQRERRVDSHFQLLWSLEYYRACRHHHRHLESHCPWCGKQQQIIPYHPEQARCTHCFGFLAPAKVLAKRSQPLAREIHWAESLESMLENPPIESLLTHSHLMQVLDMASVRWAEGTKKRLSLMLGLRAHAIGSWNYKQQRPAFPLLLQITEALGVTLRGLFTEPLPERSPSLPPGRLKVMSPLSKQAMSLPAFEATLRAQLENPASPPVSAILARLGVTRGYAKYWLPELLAELSQKHQRVRSQLVYRRREEAIKVTERVFREIATSGNYPSTHRMYLALRPHGLSLQCPHLWGEYKAWRDRLAAGMEV